MIRPLMFCLLAGLGASVSAEERDCQPGGPCSSPVEVRAVVVTLFEIGEDEGDRPGEFQLWKSRGNFTVSFPFPQGHHELVYDPERKVLAMVTGIGTMKSTANIMALGLDARFDLTKAYWLVAGIAGIDPADASLGSAVWSTYLVDGDLGHEIDPREMPADWAYPYFPRRAATPYAQPRPPSEGEIFVLNDGLRNWAYAQTKDLKLPDLPGMAEARAAFDEPMAKRPPFVLKGAHLAAMTFWHGALLNDWANHWVAYWSEGQGNFVTSAMEDTGTAQALTYLDRLGKADYDRLMVLRAGSNYTTPPPGLGAAENLLQERGSGYSGLLGAVESLYLVGNTVVDALLADWPRYRDTPPSAP
jgi:purine nucleoside permease